MGESVNNLVPSVQVGGDILRARLVAIQGTPAPVAAASVIVTITMNVLTQIIFTLMGFAAVIAVTHQAGLAKPAIAGAGLSILAIGGFYAVQRFGGIKWAAAMASRAAGSAWRSLLQDAQALDRSIQDIYSKPRGVLASAVWSMISWIVGAVEIWIALIAVGMPANFLQAFALESISQGCRTAMFFIPGGLGIQEGGYLFTGKLLGIPGETALALALIRRVRELAVGIPGLLAWQLLEGTRLRRDLLQQASAASLPPQSGPAHEAEAVSGPR
jgi:putative membrane protein